jgi:hypothetical protein
MRALLGYYARMARWAALSALTLAVALAPTVRAQINGVAPSVTSYGFGTHGQPNAPRASVTSLGPNGFRGPRPGTTVPPAHSGRDHRHTYPYYPAYYPYYPVIDPYVYSGPVDSAAGPIDEDQYQGGPTIFDRRGSGERYPLDSPPSSMRQPSGTRVAEEMPPPRVDGPPEPPQPETVLVFKDGHKQQVSNYAIVGANLFDLTSARRQKIALSDLDVAATQKANEQNGVEFKLPVLPTGG